MTNMKNAGIFTLILLLIACNRPSETSIETNYLKPEEKEAINISEDIDSIKLIATFDSMAQNLNFSVYPHKLHISYQGVEEGYDESWYFNSTFDLSLISYEWAGESLSGKGACELAKGKLIIKIDSSFAEPDKSSYTIFYKLSNRGGIQYGNIYSDAAIHVKPNFISFDEFDREESFLMDKVKEHFKNLKNLTPKNADGTKEIALYKIDSIKYGDYSFTKTTIYSMDSLLLTNLRKKMK